MEPEPSRPIRFVHRGAIVEVADAPTTTSVLYWLREKAGRVGTKEGCNEGDCGACMVIVASLDRAAPGGVALRPVNSCLQFLSGIDGRALVTVEDLAGSDPHPAQRAMVDCHGSQCGFCTPGFTMSLAACHDEHRLAGTRPTRQQLADALSGNLCRCTGYRPIIDAGERMMDDGSVAASIDRAALCGLLERLATDSPLHYRAAESRQSALAGEAAAWVAAPHTVEALAAMYAEHPDARLVAGATDVGLWVTKQFRPMPKMIRIDAVPALKAIVDEGERLSIGAGASLDDAWQALVDGRPELREMQLRFASVPLRRAGTMGGNVANGSPIGDSAPVLMALDATLVLRQRDAERRIALDDFYTGYLQNRMQPGEFIVAIEVPHDRPGTSIRAYKHAKRYDCDISAVSAGLAIRLDGNRVVDARFAFGGMAAVVRRAPAAEAAVIDKVYDEAAIEAAVRALSADFTPLSDLRASAAHRLRIAGNLLRRFWQETRAEAPLPRAAVTVWPARESPVSMR